MSRIVVTGASGWLGSHISARLEREGMVVGRICRSTEGGGDFGWDFGGSQPLGPLVRYLRGWDTIIHCAGRVHSDERLPHDAELHHLVNLEGTRRLLEAAVQAKLSRVVFLSTIAVYDWRGLTGPATEDLREAGQSAYARSKRQAEESVRESGLDWRIARLGTVFGAGDIANFLRMARAIRRRRFFVAGDGRARKSVISIDRAAEIIGRLAELEAPRHRLINVASAERPCLREICDAFSATCGLPHVPGWNNWICRLMARIGDGTNAAGIRFPYDTATRVKLATDTVVDVSRQQEMFPDLKWRGFREELAEYRGYYLAAASTDAKRLGGFGSKSVRQEKRLKGNSQHPWVRYDPDNFRGVPCSISKRYSTLRKSGWWSRGDSNP